MAQMEPPRGVRPGDLLLVVRKSALGAATPRSWRILRCFATVHFPVAFVVLNVLTYAVA